MATQSLVCVPGLMCSPDLFAPQQAALAKIADIWVPEPSKDATISGMARRILVGAPQTFALAGLSMGGYVAMEIIRQAPARVSRLALISASARADRPETVKLRRLLIGMGRTVGPRAVQSALLKSLIHPDRLKDRALTDRIVAMADAVGQAAFERQSEALIERQDYRSFLKEISCPTLVIVGCQDQMTPLKIAQEINAGIAGSTLASIPDCGHIATLEQPEAVNRLLADWLAT